MGERSIQAISDAKNPLKIFDDETLYRRPEIKAKLGGMGERKLDSTLAEVPRVALSRKYIVYPGRALNEIVERGAARGATPSRPTGACAPKAPQ